MSYDTKVLLMAVSQIVRNASTLEEAYEQIAELANVEGLIVKPMHVVMSKNKKDGK